MTLPITSTGINVPALASYPTRDMAGHRMVDLPGGWFVMGPFKLYDSSPRWVYLDPFSISTTTVSESQYQETTGQQGKNDAPGNHPVTMVSYHDALDYIRKRGSGLVLPTESQWECAARGPARNMQEAMEEATGRFRPSEFHDFADGVYENFVFEINGRIYRDVYDTVSPDKLLRDNKEFKSLLEKGIPFWGWQVFACKHLSETNAWNGVDERAPVDWGPDHGYGLKNMTGNVHEWTRDRWSKDVFDWVLSWHPTDENRWRHDFDFETIPRGRLLLQAFDSEKAKTLRTINPVGPDEGEGRVLRNTRRTDSFRAAWVAHRGRREPDAREDCFSFRVAAE